MLARHQTIEIDVEVDNKFLGRVCAPSGASVGKYEAISFPDGGPEESLKIFNQNSKTFVGLDPTDLRSIHESIKKMDETKNYSKIGGGLAFAITIAAMDAMHCKIVFD